MAGRLRQSNQDEASDSLNARQRVAAELLLKRGWVDAPPKAGIASAKPWSEIPSKEDLLAALPPASTYDPPDSDE